ncbi:MAG TPA: HAMP domain-containing sensor histidine kinase [Candidatus Acidoferrales bacterium]|nr:HAMP domain-containing sensor histidine kinase [Candidatus Acidoferrales bacterium]
MSSVADAQQPSTVPLRLVKGLLEASDRAVIVVDQQGTALAVNAAVRGLLGAATPEEGRTNVFHLLPGASSRSVLVEVDTDESPVEIDFELEGMKLRARMRALPETDWLIIELEKQSARSAESDPLTQLTVQELLQEREITYRNLLAAYLKLQEVNRQKTVFLASAAHELKTPLAVIKGYYDLLLTGSLGKLSDKQQDILEESKESCERLVRLVSMFLNYSALESGKLVLQLRENDLRDCLEELTKRWSEAFQRKGVRLDAAFDPSIPSFRFDYQKVQQAAANLLDNALKHTPAGGSVALRATPHFWERRVASVTPVEERRRFRLPRPNSVEVSVTDSGPGIAAEHHQEIFEDFVRVDRNTSGMGLGLAIAKRLIQAHRGKIWVESESPLGSKFTFLLPMDQS